MSLGISRYKFQNNIKMCLTETVIKIWLNLIVVHFNKTLSDIYAK